MGRRKPPLRVSTRGETVNLAFNMAGWEPVYAKLLESLAYNRGMPIGEFLGKAIECYGRSTSLKPDRFEDFIKMMHIEVEKDRRRVAGDNSPENGPLTLWPRDEWPVYNKK